MASVNMYGQKIDANEKWTQKGFIVECYDEYIRMGQLNQRSQISGRYILSMNFKQYLLECKKNLEFHISEMKKQLLALKISKQEHDFAYQVARKSGEAIDWYFGLNEKEQNSAIYPEEAPSEKHMKARVEEQIEKDEVANVPVPGTKGPHGGARLELRNVTKEEAKKTGASVVRVDESIKRTIKEGESK